MTSRRATSSPQAEAAAEVEVSLGMAELYVKPGNRERGWNDPPQFSYGLQQFPREAKRSPLTRRAPPHGSGSGSGSGGGDGAVPPLDSPALTPGTTTLSTGLPPLPPRAVVSPPALTAPSLRICSPKPLACQAEEDCDVQDVHATLNELLDNCRKSVQKQVCDDISKRLGLLQQMWTQGKLTAPVRRGMGLLAQELKSKHWDEADELHRSLMVDHINEVSQWMVGVKRLIAESRNLPAENLAPADSEQEVGTCLEPEHLSD